MQSIKVSTLIFILFAIFKMSSAQSFKLKGGVYVFPHIEEFVGNTYHFSLGTGYQIGLEYKLSNHFTLQADFSQTRHKFKVKYTSSTAPAYKYEYHESITILEFRYYPTISFKRVYFGLATSVYTTAEYTDHGFLSYGDKVWKDSGYKWGLTFGYICYLDENFDIEPQVVFWGDLGRYLKFDDPFGYPRLQYGVCLTYRF